jgi:hypothetical protein
LRRCSSAGLAFAGTVWRRFSAIEQIATLLIAVAAAAITALNRNWTTSLFRALSIGGAVASIYGIFQYFRVDPLLDAALY